MNDSTFNRRFFLSQYGIGPMLGMGCASFLGSYSLTPAPLIAANSSADHNRFLLIFLTGGWDSALATDPVIGSKVSSGHYETLYGSETTKSLSGKENLILGSGLLPGTNAFSSVSTAFINGMHIEVPAHDLASQYMLTGQFTLSRTSDLPAFVAAMGEAAGGFPAHVVLGSGIPLGKTAETAPPLHAIGLDGLRETLSPPGKGYQFTANSMAAINATIEWLNLNNIGEAAEGSSAALKSFRASERAILPIYEKGYAEKLALNANIKEQYGFQDGLSQAGKLASAAVVLKSGLTRFVTITTGDYDSHFNQMPRHRSQLEEFSAALGTLIADLKQTSDPYYPGDSMMDHTTICITSEFVRTPKFNEQMGTDHWQSASAILMGRGIRDNVVIGMTDDAANPLGWVLGSPTIFNDETKIGPENLAATILDVMGFSSLGQSLGKKFDDAIRS